MYKKKVLIISYYFPPFNTIGAVRIGKFAKYLPEFGWYPVVLTVDKIRGLDQTLPLETAETNVIRTPYWRIGNFIPQIIDDNQDHHAQNVIRSIINKITDLGKPIYTLPVIEEFLLGPTGWYYPGVEAGLNIIKKNNIDILFSSYGPSMSHLIAAKLHKQTKLPWVAEFRDPWSSNPGPYKRITQPFHYFEQRWEKRTMKSCDLLIDVSPKWAKGLESFHSKRTIVIRNGFDEEDYIDNIPLTPKFSITYTGDIYPDKNDPSPLFQALAELKLKELISSKDVEVHFWGGNNQKYVKPIVDKYGVNDFVKISGKIPFKDSIKKQMESTVLLLLSWNDPRDAGTLSGKIYEYLGAKRPVLAFAYKGGEIDKLLQETGCGIVMNEISEIKTILLKWLEEFKGTGNISTHNNIKSNIINKYTRKEQSRALAEVFDCLSAQNNTN